MEQIYKLDKIIYDKHVSHMVSPLCFVFTQPDKLDLKYDVVFNTDDASLGVRGPIRDEEFHGGIRNVGSRVDQFYSLKVKTFDKNLYNLLKQLETREDNTKMLEHGTKLEDFVKILSQMVVGRFQLTNDYSLVYECKGISTD